MLEYTDAFHELKSAPASFFGGQKGSVINVEMFRGDLDAIDVVLKLERSSLPLHNFADVRTGLVAYELGKGTPAQTKEMKNSRIYHSQVKINPEWFEYLQGSDVSRYSMLWSGEFIKYGDNLAAPRKDFRLYSTPRISVRQIPNKLPYCMHACYTDKILLNDRNSMNVINFKVDPMAVLAVLNSKLASFWFALKFGKLQRGLFPQFKANELADFPIPKNIKQFEAEFSDLAQRATVLREDNMRADIRKIDAEIDTLVYKAFELSSEDIAQIEKFGVA